MNQLDQGFGGFVPPKKNYFPMPNEWINICAGIDNLAELKVIQYVLRHTWGYQEFDGTPKAITIDEFMHGRKFSSRSDRKGQRIDNGTGLSNRSVIDGLRRAIDHKYLICEEDRSDKARIVKAYALNMKGAGVKNLHISSEDVTYQPDVKKAHTISEGPSQLAMKKVHSHREGSTRRSEKETTERHSEKNTEEREMPAVTPSTPEPSSLSPSSLLESLTDEQADFWQRWKAVRGCKDSAFNATAKGHVEELASKIVTTTDLQALYDFVYEGLRQLPENQGKEPEPPRLGNLVRRYDDWKAAQDAKERKREQASQKAVPGTGAIQNLTAARLAGKTDAPPLVYLPPERTERRPRKTADSMSIKGSLTAMRERLGR